MLKLTALKLDRFLSRLYVADQNARVLILVDLGVFYENTGQARFKLYERDKRGNLGASIKEKWLLLEGVDGTAFITGLQQTIKTQQIA